MCVPPSACLSTPTISTILKVGRFGGKALAILITLGIFRASSLGNSYHFTGVLVENSLFAFVR